MEIGKEVVLKGKHLERMKRIKSAVKNQIREVKSGVVKYREEEIEHRGYTGIVKCDWKAEINAFWARYKR